MSDISQRNIRYTLIGKDKAASTATRVENIANGDIVICNEYGTVLDNGGGASDVDNFTSVVIHQGGSGNGPVRSTDIINKNNITSVKVDGFAQPTEQIDFIGYNGSSGSITATNSNDYYVRMNFNYGGRGQDFPQQAFELAYYQSDSTATQAEIAQNLVELLAADARKHKERMYKAEVTSDGTTTAFTGSPILVKVTRGAKTVSFLDAALAADTGTVAAAAFVNIPSQEGRTFTLTAPSDTSGTCTTYIGETAYAITMATSQDTNGAAMAVAINAGTQATAAYDSGTNVLTITYRPETVSLPPVVYNGTGAAYIAVTIASGNATAVKYEVETGASASGSFTLTVAYQGETGYAVVGTTTATMSGVDTSPTNYGIKLTGVARSFNLYKPVGYRKSRWTTTIQGFGSTTVTNSQAAYRGSGTYWQVAEEDLFGDIVFGNSYRGDVRRPRNIYSEEYGQYGSVTITWDDTLVNTIGPRPVTRKQARIFFNDQTATNATTFLTILGDLMNTSYSF